MRLWRIARCLHANLSGEGGLLRPARWHQQGVRIIYTSTSAALASLEYAVYTLKKRPLDTMLLEIEVESADVLTIEGLIGGTLPGNWAADHQHSRPLGMEWLANRNSVVLSVPSVIIPTERNFLINPEHPRFDQVKLCGVTPFFFDPGFLAPESHAGVL